MERAGLITFQPPGREAGNPGVTTASLATIMVASDAMEERISTIDVRQQIGDLLNRVALRQDKFVIERKGRALAALVPVERLDQLRRFARRHGLEFIERQRGAGLTDRKAGDLAREATGWARRRAGKAPRTR